MVEVKVSPILLHPPPPLSAALLPNMRPLSIGPHVRIERLEPATSLVATALQGASAGGGHSGFLNTSKYSWTLLV